VRRVRTGIAGRLRRRLGISNVDDARVDEVYRQLAVFHDRLQHLESVVPPIGALDELRADIVRDMKDELLGSVDSTTAGLRSDVARLRADTTFLRAERDDAMLTQRVWATMAWIERQDVAADALVSVLMATRDRAAHVGRAIDSVLAQTYRNWELVVVDDGSVDETPAVLARYDDPRITVIRAEWGGVDAAYNVAIDAARGSLVTYLDDDNAMHPAWLRSVVWALTSRPEVDLVYGAQIREDALHVSGDAHATLPWLTLAPYDRRRLERVSFIDRNAIAHRAGLPGARFDETLGACGDWALSLALTEERDPLPLPVLATLYTTSSNDRLTGSARVHRAEARIRAQVHEHRRLRTLVYSQMFPTITETYIGDEGACLADSGMDVAFASFMPRPSPIRTHLPTYASLEEGVATFAPDLVLVQWENTALDQASRIEATGLPYAVRAHSFEFTAERTAALLARPQCVGVWAYPHFAADVPGVHALPSLLHRAPEAADGRRDLVLSVSAALPKKNWPLLLDALCALPGVERRIVVGATLGWEHVPAEVFALINERADAPLLQVNLTRDEVFGLLGRTALLVYTADESSRIGNPMSVIEAMAAGASVVVPDRPEVAPIFGPFARTYRTAEDIAAHAREALRGGLDVARERSENQAWALDHHHDPRLAKEYHRQLVAAYEAWRAGSAR
jgi:glycosyltransferase involved in cell wall biosynthesis